MKPHTTHGILQIGPSAATCGIGSTVGPLAAALSLLSTIAQAQFACWSSSAGGNGHYYEAVTSPGINWADASQIATDKGGYLATITCKEENAFIFDLIRTNVELWARRSTGNSWGPWIGGLQLPGSIEPAGGWSWVTEEPFAYANWNTGEPSNDHGIESRIHFWGDQAAVGDVWNDKPATDAVEGFVIEYEAHPHAVLLQISISKTQEVLITWPSRESVSYTVQWLDGFPSTTWSTLTNVVGNGETCSAFDSPQNGQRFYRVLSSP